MAVPPTLTVVPTETIETLAAERKSRIADARRKFKGDKAALEAAKEEIVEDVDARLARLKEAAARTRSKELAVWKRPLERVRGKFKAGLNNLLYVFEQSPHFKGVLAYNELSHDITLERRVKVAIAGRPTDCGTEAGAGTFRLTDTDVDKIRTWLDFEGFSSVASLDVTRQLELAARERRSFHPIRSYLVKCYQDHGAKMSQEEAEDVVYGFLETYCGAQDEIGDVAHDSTVTRAKSRVMLISAVARIMPKELTALDGYGLVYRRSDAGMRNRSFGPGCLAKQMVVLQGRSNLKKSSIIRALVPEQSYTIEEQIDFSDVKTATEATVGTWVDEYPEFDQALYGRASSAQCKAFTSKTKDKIRPAYARSAEVFARQFILIGSMNPERVLNDSTTHGQISRFLIVRCGVGWDASRTLDDEAVATDRDRIWGAAVKLYAKPDEGHAPALWWIDEVAHADVARKLIAGQEAFEEENPAWHKVSQWLRTPDFPVAPWRDIAAIPTEVIHANAFATVWRDKTGDPRFTAPSPQQLPQKRHFEDAMRRAGWKSKSVRTNDDKHGGLISGEFFRAWVYVGGPGTTPPTAHITSTGNTPPGDANPVDSDIPY